MANLNNLKEAITKEVAEWPGASVEFSESAKASKAKVGFGEKKLFVPIPPTGIDARAIHHSLGDVRRCLRRLGAERPKPEPTQAEDEAPYRKPNDGVEKRDIPKPAPKAKPAPDLIDKMESAAIIPAAKAKAARQVIAMDAPKKSAVAESADALAERIAAEFKARVDAIVDGIYFGLPDEIYHAVPRLSSSGIQKLCVSPATFWRNSWLDPQRPEPNAEAKDYQILGRAYHCARLEPHLFDQLYVRDLAKADAPKGTLFTGSDMGAKLEDMGAKKSGSVQEQAERLADLGFPTTQIWHFIKAKWEEERGSRQAISATAFDAIKADMVRIQSNSQVAPLLSGGESEVSVFWTDQHGVKMKARIDYLARDWWSDFKTFDNGRGKNVRQAMVDAFKYNRIYIQAVVYREAVEAIRRGGLEIVGDANDDQLSLVAALRIKPHELKCWYIFQEKNGVPNLFAMEAEFYSIPYTTVFSEQITGDESLRAAARLANQSRSLWFKRGIAEVLEAKKAFTLYSTVYKPGEAWAPFEAIGSFSDADFSDFWLSDTPAA